MKRHIIAMGGGGFSMESDNSYLDDYILHTAAKENPRICFIPTASGDSDNYTAKFYAHFSTKQCQAAHLSLFRGHTDKIRDFVLEQDILYVGGGNTKNMLILWKAWGLDQIILESYQNGAVLCGLSAGSICWFEQGLTDSIPLQLNKLDCLGILKGSNCPHFDGEEARRPAYSQLIANGTMMNGIAIDDFCGVHYIDEQLTRIVASRPNANAYSFVRNDDGSLSETILKADDLSKL